MLDQYLLTLGQLREKNATATRLAKEIGLDKMSVEKLAELSQLGPAGRPLTPAPPSPTVSAPEMAPEDIGSAVGAALKAVRDKETTQQAEQAEEEAAVMEEQSALEQGATDAQQPVLPPTFPPGQEPQPPAAPMAPGQPPAANPAAGGASGGAAPPKPGGSSKQAFAQAIKWAGQDHRPFGGSEKAARIGGVSLDPEHAGNAAIPYDARHKAYKDYILSKAQEPPTSVGKATGVGALVGGGLGGLVGGLTGGPQHFGRGALIGAGIGAGIGGLAGFGAHREDVHAIARAREMQDKDDAELGEALHRFIAAYQRQKEIEKSFQEEARHHEMLSAIRESKNAKTAFFLGMAKAAGVKVA